MLVRRLLTLRYKKNLALGQCRPGQQGYSTDACVPASQLTEMILSAKDFIQESKFSKNTAIIIGHVGDGNFHIFTGVDPNCEEELQDIRELARFLSKN